MMRKRVDKIIADQIRILKERGFVTNGEVIVNTGSTPIDLHLPTNTIKVTVVE
jgi:pyruvate kinase